MGEDGSQQFIETLVFSRSVRELGLQEALRDLQNQLIANPRVGAIDPGAGGLRKLRIGVPGRGKRGGARIYYLHLPGPSITYLVLAYAKNAQASPSPGQRAQLVRGVELLKAEWE